MDRHQVFVFALVHTLPNHLLFQPLGELPDQVLSKVFLKWGFHTSQSSLEGQLEIAPLGKGDLASGQL
jgi:hypothetical protein